MDEVAEPRFGPGDRVRVRLGDPPGHHRTPWYVKGKAGRVDALYDAFLNPETRAYGEPGLPRQPLYRIEFRQRDIWDRYDGDASDKICADVYQHWLEPA